MAAGDGHLPDWRDAPTYQSLLHADRSLLAWEWLRRNPTYQIAAQRACHANGSGDRIDRGEQPDRWGLHIFERPEATVPAARPVWSSDVHPFALDIETGLAVGEGLFDLERFRPIATLARSLDGREHLLLSDGFRTIRINVVSGTLTDGPVELRYRLAGLASAERPVLTLRRLLALWRNGRFSCSLHSDEARARRWVLMLRAHDALAAGAGQREIAAVMLSTEASAPRWRNLAPSVRAQVQRLVRGARRMASGGYLDLLQ